MISFAGILQRFCPEVQNSYFVEHGLMTIQKILEYSIVYYISRHCLKVNKEKNKKSRNSSSLIIKEKNDKNGVGLMDYSKPLK